MIDLLFYLAIAVAVIGFSAGGYQLWVSRRGDKKKDAALLEMTMQIQTAMQLIAQTMDAIECTTKSIKAVPSKCKEAHKGSVETGCDVITDAVESIRVRVLS